MVGFWAKIDKTLDKVGRNWTDSRQIGVGQSWASDRGCAKIRNGWPKQAEIGQFWHRWPSSISAGPTSTISWLNSRQACPKLETTDTGQPGVGSSKFAPVWGRLRPISTGVDPGSTELSSSSTRVAGDWLNDFGPEPPTFGPGCACPRAGATLILLCVAPSLTCPRVDLGRLRLTLCRTRPHVGRAVECPGTTECDERAAAPSAGILRLAPARPLGPAPEGVGIEGPGPAIAARADTSLGPPRPGGGRGGGPRRR